MKDMSNERKEPFASNGIVYHGDLEELNSRGDNPYQYEFIKGYRLYGAAVGGITEDGGAISLNNVKANMSERGIDGVVNARTSFMKNPEKTPEKHGELAFEFWVEGTPVLRIKKDSAIDFQI